MNKKFLSAIIVCLAVILCFFIAKNSFAKEQEPNNQEKGLEIWVPYDHKKPESINNIENKNVFVRQKDYESLKERKLPAPKEEIKAPQSYTISEASFKIDILGEGVTAKGTYKINKLDDEWVLIPFLQDNVALTEASLNGQKALTTSYNSITDKSKFTNYNNLSGGYYYLPLKKRGFYTLTTTHTQDISKGDPKSFRFNLPDIPIVTLYGFINKKNIEFSAPNAVALASKNIENGTKLFASLTPGNAIELSFSPKATQQEIKNAKKATPMIKSTTFSKIEVGRGNLKGTIQVDLDINHKPQGDFTFLLPENDSLEIDFVKTSNKNTEIVDPAPNVKNGILPVELTAPVEGPLNLTIQFRKGFDSSSFETRIPPISLKSPYLEREEGYVGVLEITNVEAKLSPDQDTGKIQLIPQQDLKGFLQGLNTAVAFKYFKYKEDSDKLPYDIDISVKKYENAAVNEANISEASILTVVSTDGRLFNKVLYKVNNTRKQFMSIQLPKGSSLWSVYVDGESEQASIKDEKENIYSIPLAKTINAGKPDGTPIEIVYYTDNSFLLPLSFMGIKNLKSISTELNITSSTQWEIYLPMYSQYKVCELLSNMNQDKKQVTQAYKGKIQGLFGSLSNERKAMLSSKSDYNEFSDEIAAEESFVQAPSPKKEADSSLFQKRFKPKEIGKLPVYVDLPEVGYHISMVQGPMNQNETPKTFIGYINKSLLGYIILVLFGLSIYGIARSHKTREYRSPTFIISAVVLAILLYITAIPAMGSLLQFLISVIKVIFMILLLLIPILIALGVLALIILLIKKGIKHFKKKKEATKTEETVEITDKKQGEQE